MLAGMTSPLRAAVAGEGEGSSPSSGGWVCWEPAGGLRAASLSAAKRAGPGVFRALCQKLGHGGREGGVRAQRGRAWTWAWGGRERAEGEAAWFCGAALGAALGAARPGGSGRGAARGRAVASSGRSVGGHGGGGGGGRAGRARWRGCRLQVASYKLQAAGCKMQDAGCSVTGGRGGQCAKLVRRCFSIHRRQTTDYRRHYCMAARARRQSAHAAAPER